MNSEILDNLMSKLRKSVEHHVSNGVTLEQFVAMLKSEQMPIGMKVATNSLTTADGERLAVLLLGILYKIYGKEK